MRPRSSAADVDALLFRVPVPGHRDSGEWDAIVQRLTSTLAETLGVPLEVRSRRVVDEVALSLRLWSVEALAGPLELGLTVLAGFEVIDQRPCVDASVFLFADGDRLASAGRPRMYADLVYDATGRWTWGGWRNDEYKEFASVPAPAAPPAAGAPGASFLAALTALSAQPPGPAAAAARAEAMQALEEWQARSDGPHVPSELSDLAAGLSETERAELVKALRELAAWAERPDARTGQRVDETLAWLDHWLGPWLTLGTQAERAATDQRITSSVQSSIADRLRASGAAGGEPSDGP